jgi:hypothetical protein
MFVPDCSSSSDSYILERLKDCVRVVSFYLLLHFVSAPKTFASKFIAIYDFALVVVL